MIRWRAVNERVPRRDKAQRKTVSALERRVKISEEQPDVPKTAPRKDRSRRREERDSGSESSRGKSSREVIKSRVSTD